MGHMQSPQAQTVHVPIGRACTHKKILTSQCTLHMWVWGPHGWVEWLLDGCASIQNFLCNAAILKVQLRRRHFDDLKRYSYKQHDLNHPSALHIGVIDWQRKATSVNCTTQADGVRFQMLHKLARYLTYCCLMQPMQQRWSGHWNTACRTATTRMLLSNDHFSGS